MLRYFSKLTIEIVLISLISIVFTFIYAYISYSFIHNEYPSTFLSIWNRWDTVHYLNIAKDGYSSSPTDNKNILIVFFPLYPLLIKSIYYITGSYLVSAILISNAAYILACLFLYKIISLDYFDKDSTRAVIYFSIFPTAYFLHAGYTESLYLFLTIASFYYARKENWMLSGIFAMLSILTRITGILLIPALFLEYMYQKNYKINKISKSIFWFLLPIFGLFIYIIINFITYGDPFEFLDFQKTNWQKGLAFPTQGIVESWKSIWWRAPNEAFKVGLFEILFPLTALLAFIFTIKKLRISYSLFIILNLIFITSNTYWLSLPRYILGIFPIFISLSLIGRNKYMNYIFTLSFLLLYALFLTEFVRSQWAF